MGGARRLWGLLVWFGFNLDVLGLVYLVFWFDVGLFRLDFSFSVFSVWRLGVDLLVLNSLCWD